ncbi:MAG: carbohydrate binding family 9 domain-containing protein, partial [Cyclobacteriaceae bacterium]|nr:carbohydrate binding family 9 domain-containing protein [Cyclobacteriaceae bacterium]
MYIRFFFSVILLSMAFIANSQDFDNNFEEYQYFIKKAKGSVTIDGKVEEEDWTSAQVLTDFRRILPIDSGTAESITEAMLTYDDDNLYITIICYEEFSPVIIESMRRDWSFGKNDNFLVNIDPFNDKTNGFAFGCNAAGAQWDAMLINGGSANLDWDNAWYSATLQYEDRWVTEMAIPFKILRYNSDVDKWGINFSRLDKKRNHEKSSWAPVPRQFPSVSLAFTGSLVWDQPPPKTGTNITLIPYALGGITADKDKGISAKATGDVGLNAKVSVTQSVNLDLTVNPDFSHVEVDRQVLNLSRFEIYYPERRQFFLENSDLFSGYGNQRMRPFFSRR